MKSFSNDNILALRQQLEAVLQQITLTHQQRDNEGIQLTEPAILSQATEQYLEILDKISAGEDIPEIEQEEIVDLGDYGLSLLSELTDWASVFQLTHELDTLHHATLALSVWLARNEGTIRVLEQLVNSISAIANKIKEPAELADLSTVIAEVITIVAPENRQDTPDSPWRMLNLNYGIVATRSYDPEIMRTTFELLISHIPAGVAAFFKEGMEQMDIVGYPAQVRSVMEKYHQMTQRRTLH